MKAHLMWLLLDFALLAGYGATWQKDTTLSYNFQSGCIEHFIGNAEVLMSKIIDVDHAGNMNQVAVYADMNDIRLLILANPSSENCTLVLNERLFSRVATIQQKIDVRELKAIELTDSDQPALHVWLDKSGLGSGPYRDVTFHAIYIPDKDKWKRVFMVEQCLAYSSFELRETLDRVRQIYLDEDNQCRAPFSSRRDYYIFQWNGTSFDRIETGTVDKWTVYSPNLYVYCILLVVIGVVITGVGVMIMWRSHSWQSRSQLKR